MSYKKQMVKMYRIVTIPVVAAIIIDFIVQMIVILR